MQHLGELASAMPTQLGSLTSWKSRLENTHQEPTRQQSTIRLRQALTCRNDAEDERIDSQKIVGSNARQRHDHVAGDLNQYEWNKKDPQAGRIAIQWHIQALLKAFNPRIGNCA
jgi:hypothetical protein